MAYSWAKIYIEVLDDHKMGLLPDSLWRRVIELILLAKKLDKDGWLPGLMEMSWTLRMPAEKLEADLTELSKTGIVELKDGNWFLTNFAKRQAFEPVAERVRNYRKRNVTDQCNDGVTNRYTDKTRLDTDLRQESFGASAPAKKPLPQKLELRFDATPEGALMAQKLRAVYDSKGRRAPETYANASQREAFLTAINALGSKFASLLETAMERDITERGRLLSWLQACAKKNGNGNDQPRVNIAEKAIQISNARKEAANGKP
jgi:hypothetical protein